MLALVVGVTKLPSTVLIVLESWTGEKTVVARR
jgi:hypothetical protein